MYDIYSNGGGDRWRFALGKTGHNNLFVIALNPSTANKEKSDLTASKVEAVARRNGFDGFILLNLYPVRSTKVQALPHLIESEAFVSNLQHIEERCKRERYVSIWAAWGESILARKFLIEACKDLFGRLQKYNPKWCHFGTLTATGHPRHPSRIKYAWNFNPFDIRQYGDKLDSGRA